MPDQPRSSPSERAALLYQAGEDLWRAAEAIRDARAKFAEAEYGVLRMQANKLTGLAEGLAGKAERVADGVMEAPRA